jgi:hypothetical protein
MDLQNARATVLRRCVWIHAAVHATPMKTLSPSEEALLTKIHVALQVFVPKPDYGRRVATIARDASVHLHLYSV